MKVKGRNGKSQIAIEFVIVYSIVLLIFLVIFALVANERAYSLQEQEYSELQLITQTIAEHIDIAMESGNGYLSSITLPSTGTFNNYNLSLSSGGEVIATMKVGNENITALSYSAARNMQISGTPVGYNFYRVPSSGTMEFYNNNGHIIINSYTAGYEYLADHLKTSVDGYGKVANFNGNSYITIPNTSELESNSFTWSIWIYPTSWNPNNGGLLGQSNSGTGAPYMIEQGSTTTPKLQFSNDGGGGSSTYADISYFKWQNIVGTYNYTNGEMSLYVNGALISNVINTPISRISGPIYIGYFPSSGNYFQGSMANLQIYNEAVNSSYVKYIYSSGMNGAPANFNNLVGWWTLNGNINNYLSNYTSSPLYTSQGLTFSNSFLLSMNASNILNNQLNGVDLGLVTGAGTLGSPLRFTNYITSNTVSNFTNVVWTNGTDNVTVNAFNGNLFSESNLVGWYPLDLGYGNTIFDLSGIGNIGHVYGNYTWENESDYAKIYVANFTPSSPTYIEVPPSDVLLDIARNNSFTLSAWVYYKGPSTEQETIISDINKTANSGFMLYINKTGNLSLEISNHIFSNKSVSVPKDRWTFVTAEYNFNTGSERLFENDILINSSTASFLPITQYSPYYIGYNSSIYPDTFNGSIANIQLYADELKGYQIADLYKSGIASAPLGGSNLVAWFTLDNTTDDYGYNTTVIDSPLRNVKFTSAEFSKYINSRPYLFLNGSSGANSARINSTIGYWLGTNHNFTVVAWFNSPYNGGPIVGIDDSPPGDGWNMPFISMNRTGYIFGWVWGTPSIPFKGLFNTTYFAALTYNKSSPGIENFYIDGGNVGSSVGEYSSSGGMDYLTTFISGAKPPNTPDNFTGTISDIQIYNSTLNGTEIEQLYEQGLPPYHKYSLHG